MQHPRAVRWLAGAIALALLSGAYWSVSLDDAFISAAYATQWLETSELAWPGGERYEGYSSLPWILVHALALRFGWDPIAVAKLVAGLGGVGILGLASRALPLTSRGHWAFAALVSWTPLAVWSALPMEATLFALAAAAAWMFATRGDSPRSAGWGAWASLLRPEGVLWLLLSACYVTRERRRGAGPFVAALGAVALYHGWRWHYFGALASGPMLMKAKLGWMGPLQIALELVGALGVLVTSQRLTRAKRRDKLWMHAPLMLSFLVVVAIDGDWMGDGRMLLPGAVAMVCGATALGTAPRRANARWDTIASVLVAGALATPFLEPPTLRRLRPTWGDGIDTPLTALLDSFMRYDRHGATVQCADVGAVAHIPHLRVVDSRGLVSPAFARARRNDRWDAIRVGFSESPPDAIAVSRFLPSWVGLLGEEVTPYDGLDPWLRHLDSLLAQYPHRQDVFTRERGWLGAMRIHRRLPPTTHRQLWTERARGLHARFPAHPWLTWQLALSLAAQGDLPGAEAAIRRSGHEDRAPMTEIPASLTFPEGSAPPTYSASRGFLISPGELRTSIPLSAPMRLRVDAPQGARITVAQQSETVHEVAPGVTEVRLRVGARATVSSSHPVHILLR